MVSKRAARVLALYRNQPVDGVVISFDEMGPVSLCPHHGRGWVCPILCVGVV